MSTITLEKVVPQSLTEQDFQDIHYFTQDLWADGSNELIQCHTCGQISGKQDVFSHLPKEIYRETVSRIFEILEQEFPIPCPSCDSHHTTMVHDAENVTTTIKGRIFDTIESSMVIMRESESQEIIGYMEAYVDTFDKAFQWELQPHYPGISSREMKNRIEDVLGRDASTIIVFPALGISQKYRTPFILARLLRYFAENTYFSREEDIPGLMEIGKDNTTYKIFMDLGGYSLNDTDPSFFDSHVKASSKYPSVIAVFSECMIPFREKLTRNSVRRVLCS